MKEKIEQAAPALSEHAQQLWPTEAVPAQDVGGDDLPGVKLRVEIRRREQPGKDAVEVLIAETLK